LSSKLLQCYFNIAWRFFSNNYRLFNASLFHNANILSIFRFFRRSFFSSRNRITQIVQNQTN